MVWWDDPLLLFNSNIWPDSAPFRDVSFQNLSDLHFYLREQLVKGGVPLHPHMTSYLFLIVKYGI